MKTHATPILFNTAMMQALLAGHKTQTRRVLSPQPTPTEINHDGGFAYWRWPLLIIGDRFWVRETHWIQDGDQDPFPQFQSRVTHVGGAKRCYYRAGSDLVPQRWRPSIHMPRWASRFTLLVDGVRVERLQDITEGDAIKEGVGALDLFAQLWDKTRDKRAGKWADNPWVVIYDFEVMR